MRQIPPKRCHLYTSLQGVIRQKCENFISRTIRKQYLTHYVVKHRKFSKSVEEPECNRRKKCRGFPPLSWHHVPINYFICQTASQNKNVVMFYFLTFEMPYFHSREVLYVGVSCHLLIFGGAYCLPVQVCSFLVRFPEMISYNTSEIRKWTPK
jgi:hypothetical protein